MTAVTQQAIKKTAPYKIRCAWQATSPVTAAFYVAFVVDEVAISQGILKVLRPFGILLAL